MAAAFIGSSIKETPWANRTNSGGRLSNDGAYVGIFCIVAGGLYFGLSKLIKDKDMSTMAIVVGCVGVIILALFIIGCLCRSRCCTRSAYQEIA